MITGTHTHAYIHVYVLVYVFHYSPLGIIIIQRRLLEGRWQSGMPVSGVLHNDLVGISDDAVYPAGFLTTRLIARLCTFLHSFSTARYAVSVSRTVRSVCVS